MPPKKKGQKVALADFLADETTGGSWADEMESMVRGSPRSPSFEPRADFWAVPVVHSLQLVRDLAANG